ncbi:hypothetical protein AY599_04065 [Leptolyngbya valderiana BDU 20041]|nr:hypothetical protein AY599_04065 [Leptolyngbya valderiana BDU 20041]
MGIDEVLEIAIDKPNQIAQMSPQCFQHRRSDVYPPRFLSGVLNAIELFANWVDVGFVRQSVENRSQAIAQTHKSPRLVFPWAMASCN